MSTSHDFDALLRALAEQLRTPFELVAIGGSALLALGLIDRATRDVDLVAIRHEGVLIDPRPLPVELVEARDRVASDFGVPGDWLNAGPADLLQWGLPDGFAGRLDRRGYGPNLVVDYASRFDQIHFKLYALADRGPGKHDSDLQRLNPTREELLAAAAWARTHDPSPDFATLLANALRYLGVEDAAISP